MKEKSQIEDMRAALRGDLERSRARGQSGGLLEVEPEPEPEPEPEAEHVPEQEAEQEPAPEELRPGIFGSLFRRR